MKDFEKNKPPGWTENSIEYASNKHGYRSVDFEDNDNFTVASFGCSFTYGTGVTVEQTWPKLFCDLLQEQNKYFINNYNLGWPAASADRICRMLFASASKLKPDLVLILFPDMYRLEIYDEEGNADRISPSNDWDAHYYETYANYHEAKNNFLKNFLFIKTFLEARGTPWLFSTWDHNMKDEMADHKNCAGKFQQFENDWARDMKHPGVGANNHLASLFLQKYNQLYT